MPEVTTQNPESTYEALRTYGTDLTSMAREGKLDPVIGRDEEIRRAPRQHHTDTKNRFWKQECQHAMLKSYFDTGTLSQTPAQLHNLVPASGCT